MEPSTKVSNDEITRYIREATESVFSTMLALSVEPLPARQESGDPGPVDGIVSIVGIAGTWTGTGRIYCSADCACKLASAMLCAQYTNVDEEVLDSMAEVANMIIGNLKTALEERLGPLGLGVPTVIFGRNYQARTVNVHDWTVVPFQCEGQTIEIRFCLMPSQSGHPLHRHHPTHEPSAV